MELSNEKVSLLINALLKFEVSYEDVGDYRAKILFNGYNSYDDYYRLISKLEAETHNEIYTNLLLLTDEKSRKDYLFRLWRQSSYTNSVLSEIYDLIKGEMSNINEIRNYTGYVGLAYDLKFSLPPLDYMFVIEDYFDYKYKPVENNPIYIPIKIEKFIEDFNSLHSLHEDIFSDFLVQLIKDAGFELPKLHYYKDDDNDEIDEKRSLRLPKDKLSLKQQVLLIEKLGILELDRIKELTVQNRGKLFSHLLNSSEKNTTEYLRNVHLPAKDVSMDKYFVQTDENIKKVTELLNIVKFNKL